MIWENTKLLLGLLYRPVASMGRIVDEGHWLYAAVVVAALSMIFHASVTSLIYNNYEAVYREIPTPDKWDDEEAENLAPGPDSTANEAAFAQALDEDDGETAPHFFYEQVPLPLVGKRAWWFVSFAPP